MSGSAPGRREVAYRLFAAEFDDAEYSYSESDEERAPNYVVTPTGARVNRLFAVGVLTEVDDVNPEMVRGRVVDPTGAFVTYAGQYQPDALAYLERADPPTFVALTGKARTFEPDDDDVVYSSVRPESVNTVDSDTRDRWVVTAADRTVDRIGVMAAAIDADLARDPLRAALEEAGVDERLADGVALALEFYDTTPAYLGALRETALNAARVVAGERDEAGRLDVAPDAAGGPDAPTAADLATIDLSGLPTTPVAGEGSDASEASTATDAATGGRGTDRQSEGESPVAGTDVEVSEATAASAADSDAGSDAAPEAESSDTEPSDTEPASDTPAGAEAEGSADESDEPDDFDPGEFELDDETRREVEEEYGTEFSTADEVEAADVDSTEPDAEPDAATAVAEADETSDAAVEDVADDAAVEEGTEDEADDGESDDAAPEAVTDDATAGDGQRSDDAADVGDVAAEDDAGDVDLEDAVMDAMERVGEGEGADRETLVAAVVDEHGADPAAVEDAIEDALMSGRCYEPSEGTLKAI